MSRHEIVAGELGFRIQGAVLYPKKGMARAATEEEKQMWKRMMGMVEEIERLQPVQPCRHISSVLNKRTGMQTCTHCGEVWRATLRGEMQE